VVGEARSLGLVGAIEIVKNKDSRERFVNNGIVMRPVGDTMIVSPPLIVENRHIDELVEKAWKCLDLTADSLGVGR
jgi:putrescine aminotransferase